MTQPDAPDLPSIAARSETENFTTPDERRCTCTPHPYGDGVEVDCPVHGTEGEIDLEDLLIDYLPAQPQPWTWDDEERDILDRVCICCGKAGHYLAQMEAHLREHGLTEGVCLGDDGRVWDGHHRIVAARRLGITRIPLESPERATERWIRDEGHVDWAQRKHGDRAPWEVDLRRKGLHYV